MLKTNAHRSFMHQLVAQLLILTLLCPMLAPQARVAAGASGAVSQSGGRFASSAEGAGGGASQGGSCPAATAGPATVRLTYTGQVGASCGGPLPVSARLTDECGNGLGGRQIGFAVGGVTASASTDANGVASTSLVPAAAGTLHVSFVGGDGYSPAQDSAAVRVARVNTSIRYAGPAVLAAGVGETVSAVLTNSIDGTPVANAVLNFEVGSARASARTDASGVATANVRIPAAETFERAPLKVTFAGDDCRGPAATAAQVTAYLRTSFVIWGGNAERPRLGQQVNFWGHSWAKQVTAGDYKAHNDFKGYADTVRQFGLCQAGVRTSTRPPLDDSCWSTKPGQSFPPETLPEFIGVIVTTSADKRGAPDFGNIAALVVLKVAPQPRYGAVPGKPGFGTIVAVIADEEGLFPQPPSLTASQSQPAAVLPAQSFNVGVALTNNSAAPAANVSVSQSFASAAPAEGSAEVGALAARESRTHAFGVTVPALPARREGESSAEYQKRLGAADGSAYASQGVVSFRDAQGRAMPPLGVSSFSRLRIPRLAVGISATSCVSPGATIPYVVALTNLGSAPAATATAVVTFPDGTTASVAASDLAPGAVFSSTVNWTVPAVAAKGPAEPDADYLARLASFDGKSLKTSASVTWRDALGNAYGAVEQECSGVLRVPVLSQTAQPPQPMLPGQRLTLNAAVRNTGTGHAPQVRLRVNNPDASVFDAPPFGLVPGGSSNIPATLTAPPVPAKGAEETDDAYRARLQSADNRPIDFSLGLEWTDAAGNTYGPVTGLLRTTEVVPVLLLTLAARETVESGESVTYRATVENLGHAQAAGVGAVVTLPDGKVQTVTLPTATLAPGEKQSGVVNFAVPADRPEGPLSALASAAWSDVAANGYGPASAGAVTGVVNPNRPPAVNAGPDQSVVLPAAVQLPGIATDDGKPAGSALNVLWTKVSGPGTVTFAEPTRAATSASFGAAGTYVLRLTAGDSALDTSDEATVTVAHPPAGPVYGVTADFTQGEGVNIARDEFNHLHVKNEATPFNFIWVAVSSKGTVVKIDTDTGRVVGEYYTSPDGEAKNPSRTTVDLNGNVWASNRDGNSVVRIGLVENGQCVDRNRNGRIDTSAGQDDLRPWTNANGADAAGGVTTAQDECVINYTRVRAYGTRHVSVNAANDVWVSGTGGQQFDLIDGATGQIKRQESPVGYGGYGGLIDKKGVIWSARPMLRWDTALPLKGGSGGNWRGYGHDSYGLCIDGLGNVWNTSLGGDQIHKFAPDGTLLGSFRHGDYWAQGCVTDKRDHVWVAHSLYGGTVGHLKPDGTWVGNVPVGSGPTGVAVDAKGKVWATNHNSRTVSRIDPELGPMGADGETRVGQVDFTTVDLKGYLYNYSDMTGSTLSGAPASGTWTQLFDSQLAGAEWGLIAWTGRACGDASLVVSVSSSDDGQTFSAPAAATNGAAINVPPGRHLKVSVTFKRASSGQSPFLYDLTVGTKGFNLPAAPDLPPAVDAGPDQTATMPNPVSLVGSACDAGRVSSLAVTWEKVAGPGEVSFDNARVPATSATFGEAGEYRLRLRAADAGASSADETTVVVLPFNDAPVVNAGADQTLVLPDALSLSGSVRDDALPKNSSVTVSWGKLSGPGEVSFGNATTAATTATFSEPGDYVLRLTGNDSQYASADDLKVTVHPPNGAPSVLAGPDQTLRLPEKANLDASVTDDGLPQGKPVNVAWTKASGPGEVSFAAADAVDTTATFEQAGTYVLRLTASDSQRSASDELTVVVKPANQPPSVNAGADQSVTLPDLANLGGAVSDDGLPEGQAVTAAWTKVSGPGLVVFGAPAEPATTARFSEPGAYVLRLSAGDSALTRSDDVTVNVGPGAANLPPWADAGPDQIVTLPAKAELAGVAADDRQPAGASPGVAWSKVSGPGAVAFDNAASAATAAAFSSAGSYVLRLTVGDTALTTADEVNVTVLPVNRPPTVEAGADQLIAFKAAATLRGTADDDGMPEGGRLTFAWTKVGGPGQVNFADASAKATSATFSAGGRYVLRLTASDSSLTGADDVNVTVNEEPTVEAGADLSIYLPASAALNGAVRDDALPPGQTIAVAWTKVSGPGAVTFDKSSSASTAAAFGEVGTYVLRLTASDSLLEAADEVTVNVRPPLPPPPSVAIESPADGAEVTTRVAVTGSASGGAWRLEYSLGGDPAATDGWTTFASGSAPGSNGVLGTFDPTLLLNGTYAIRLTAADEAGRTASVTRSVVVDGQQKVGNFTISFQDLAIPVAGLPIQLIRTYDSRDKRVGDFGVGWTLGVRNVRLEKTVPLGSEWRGVVSGRFIPQYCLQPSRPNIVTVTLPDDRVYKFQATTNRQCQSLVPIQSTTFGFTPMPGTRGSLVPEAPLEVWVLGGFPGPVELYDPSGEEVNYYDPTVFRFTDENGTSYVIDQKLGVRSITDANGQTLTINRDGVIHSGGKSVRFARDEQGRITQITDPAGNALTYSYDARGDLVAFRDRESAETKFRYNATHGLLDIIDPRGVAAVRNEYDEAGRLVSQTDAEGHKVVYARDLDARQELITDRLGRATLYEYDGRGNVLRITRPDGGVQNYTYDERGNVLSEADAGGHQRSYAYDAADNLTRSVDPAGKVTTFTYNSRGQLLSVNNGGVTTTNTFDAKGNLTSATDALGHVTSHTYDADGRLATTVDALGGVTRFAYDAGGNVSEQTDPLGNVTRFTYDAQSNRITQSVSRATAPGALTLLTAFAYDKQGRPLKVTTPDGAAASFSYTPAGGIAASVDQLGRRTSYEYDARGRAVRTLLPDGTVEQATYDAEGRRLTSTDRAGRVTRFEYDQLGRPSATTYPDGATRRSAYDAIGRPVSTTDEEGHVIRYEYDLSCGDGLRCAKTTDALNNVTTSAFDIRGNRVWTTDAAGRTTRYEYDALGRLTRVVYPDSTSAVTAYDAVGRVVSKTDQAGKTTRMAYDLSGRLARVTEGESQPTLFTYDESGNVLSQADALGRVTRYEYDGLNRRVRRTLPLGMSETYAYDPAGNLVARTDFAGKTTGYDYDAMNRLVRKRPDPSLREGAVSFRYTATGARAAMEDATGTTAYGYDARDRLTSKATPRGTLSYTYDRVGNLLSLRSSNADGASASYSYDALNRLSAVTDEGPQGGTRPAAGSTAYGYDAVGNQTSSLYSNGVRTEYAFDGLNRLTDVNISKAARVAGFAYELGPAGNRLSVTEAGGRKVSYRYDALRRLVGEEVGGVASGGGAVSYTYDPVGNRLGRESTLAAVPSSAYAYDANDRLTADTYDANGNTVASGGNTYTYDFEGRLKGADNGRVNVTYDGDGNRVAQTVNGVTTSYLVDDRNPTGLSQVVEEHVAGRVTRVYTYGHARVCQNQRIDGAWRLSFYGYDGHGSVRLLTDREGNVTDTYDYDAFGNLLRRTGATPNEYLYAGQRRDQALGLDYLRARYMNPNTGRFWSMDGFEGFDDDPLSLHKYLYANSDPVNHTDPSGNLTLAHVGAAISVAMIIQSTVGFAMNPGLVTGAFLAFDIFTAPFGFAKALVKVFGRAAAGEVIRLALQGVKYPEEASALAAKVWLHGKGAVMFMGDRALQLLLKMMSRSGGVVDFIAHEGGEFLLVEAKTTLAFGLIQDAFKAGGKFHSTLETLAQLYASAGQVMPDVSRLVITYKELRSMGAWTIASDGRLLFRGVEQTVEVVIDGVVRRFPVYAEMIPF